MFYKPVIITSYGMLGTVASTDMSKTKAGFRGVYSVAGVEW